MSKKLAEHNRRVRDERKEEGGLKRFEAVHSELEPDTEPSSSFSLTQILSVVSMVLSLAGLYYKRRVDCLISWRAGDWHYRIFADFVHVLFLIQNGGR